MRTKSLMIRTVVGAILAVCLTSLAEAQQKYAVLISGGQATIDNQMYHSEYWYDLCVMYRMLIDRGFTHNNIFVLYGNGADFASTLADYQTTTMFPGVAQITDFANSEANVTNMFNWLATGNAAQGVLQVQPGDFVFFWWMGHGSWDGDDASGNHLYHALIQNTGEEVTDAEFAAMFGQLPACVIKTVLVMTCHSGALLDDIEGLHMMAHTSSRYDQNSFSGTFDVVHADFTYHMGCALRQLTPTGTPVASDADGNGILTVREGNNYAHAQTTSSETVVSDYRGIAPRVVLASAQPAATVPTQFVYSRDCAEDDGTPPPVCVTTPWYEGPDLWVRWADDGGTTNQDPEFGQTNFIHARVHNIGCAPLSATAALTWSEMSAWMNPAAWSPVGTLLVNNLVPGERRVVSSAWNSVPLPGKYCLHTTLDAPGDPANADGRAVMDNNKVQVNVTVEDTMWSWTKKHYWLLENGRNEKSLVDLVITKPEFAPAKRTPRIQIALPQGLKFQGVSGAAVRSTQEGQIVDLPARARRVVVKGIPLGPLEKREAVLTVVMPPALRANNSVTVRVSEEVEGREMGGIVFHTRAAPQREVLAHSLRRMESFFGVLAKAGLSQQAEKLAALCRRAAVTAPQSTKAFTGFMKEAAGIAPDLRREIEHLLAGDDARVMNKALDHLVASAQASDMNGFVLAEEAIRNASKPFFRKRMTR